MKLAERFDWFNLQQTVVSIVIILIRRKRIQRVKRTLLKCKTASLIQPAEIDLLRLFVRICKPICEAIQKLQRQKILPIASGLNILVNLHVKLLHRSNELKSMHCDPSLLALVNSLVHNLDQKLKWKTLSKKTL